MSHHPGSTTRSPWRVAALLALVCGAAVAAPLDDIRRQVDAGQYEQAYQTAQANPQLIGDVHFDFLYGIAAINAGRVPEGLLALERHLSAVPANDRARLELAKGYYVLGEYGRARAEFELVLRYNPPAGVRATINSFLQNMQVRENIDERSSARLYAEVGIGHDNNVNLGTYHPVVPQLSPLPLAGKSRQIADTGALVAVGGQQTWRVSNRLSLFGGADLDNRANGREIAQDFDLANAAAHVGFNYLGAGALWRTTLTGSAMWVGHNRYRDKTLLATEGTWSLAPGLSVTALANHGEQRFPGGERVRNGRLTQVGGSSAWSPEGLPWQPTFGARLTFQQEDNRRRSSANLDRQLANFRLSASVSPTANVRLVAAGYAEDVQHGGPDEFTWGSTRHDQTLGAEAALNWALDQSWSLRAEASWTITDSNQDLFDTSRKTLSLKLRYQY